MALSATISIKSTLLGVLGLYLASQRHGLDVSALPFTACGLPEACFEGNALFYLPEKCIRLHQNNYSQHLTSDVNKGLSRSKSNCFTGGAMGGILETLN